MTERQAAIYREMTSVERLLNKKTDRKDIEERIAEAVKKVFG